jgi:predicted extracellular nuclease
VRDITWERPLFYTEIRMEDGTPIHVLNVHYKSKRPTNIAGQTFPGQSFKWRSSAAWAEGFFISSMKRVGAALETRIFVDEIIRETPGAHVVVCGDMNAETWEVPMQALRGEVADTQNPDLQAFTLYPCEETVPADKRFSLFHLGQKNMLDHLLVSQSMICCYRGTEIHNEIVRDESVAFAFDKKFPSSDHAPVVAEFDLEPDVTA